MVGRAWQKEALGRGAAQRQMLMDGLGSLEPDPSQRPDCSAGSRVQPQRPSTMGLGLKSTYKALN